MPVSLNVNDVTIPKIMNSKISRRAALASTLALTATARAADPEQPDKSPGSGGGRARPLAQSYTVACPAPEPNRYAEGRGLLRLPNGAFLAVAPVAPRAEFTKEPRPDHSHPHLLRSGDAGLTWTEISKHPYYSAA